VYKRQSDTNSLYLGSGKLINLSIKKYGIENFYREILEYCESKEHQNEREIFWINKLDSKNPIVGYNILDGGEGGWDPNIWKNRKHRQETRNKISANHHDVKGAKNPMYNKKHTDFSKNKIRLSKLGTNASKETRINMSLRAQGEGNSRSKLKVEDVINIRNRYKNGEKIENIVKEYPVEISCIWKIVNNKTWKNILE
jgi:group I intron endonuclease